MLRDGDRFGKGCGKRRQAKRNATRVKDIAVIELLRTNDPALLSYVEALLKDAAVAYFIADRHISLVEGSIGAFPRRVLVDEEDEAEARRILSDADLGSELRTRKS